jgi:hypothetical protein
MTRVTYACLMPSIRYGIPSFSVFSGLSWGLASLEEENICNLYPGTYQGWRKLSC